MIQSSHQRLNKSASPARKREEDQKPIDLNENEEEDVVIVPLRQAKSQRNFDPLKSEEVLNKYKLDENIECNS
jgi:hypothetical protein